jgi:uncharacterized surface protein with fasciclin (FAS1) repeats
MRKLLPSLVVLAFFPVSCARSSEPPNNLVDVLEAEGRFSVLLQIVRHDAAVRFFDFMTSNRDLTLFAPSDEAFDALPPAELQAILEDSDRTRDLLAHHLAEPTLMLTDLKARARSDDPLLSTGGCCLVRLTLDGDRLMVNNATVVEADIEASNGVIHVVDQVIDSVPI